MSKLRKLFVLAITAMFATGFIMSCDSLSESDLGIETKENGTVVFRITDAPFPADLVDEANVTVDWIKILKYPSVELEEEGSDSEAIYVELEEPTTYNLMELRNGLTANMAEVDLPAGSYSEIRLHVVNAEIILKDGTSHAMKVPGGNSSGLKIKMNPELVVEEGLQTEVLFDFDLSRSFVMQGNPRNIRGFIFKPVVRAIANVQTNSGVISGVVADENGNAVGNASLTLYKGEDEVTSAITSEDEGFYSMIGILPGNYKLVLEVNDYVSEADVVVEAGATTIQNFLIQEAASTETDGETSEEDEDAGNEAEQEDSGDANTNNEEN